MKSGILQNRISSLKRRGIIASSFPLRHYLAIFVLVSLIGSCTASKTPTGESKQEKINDVAYGTDPRNVMDVYLPAQRNVNTPFVLLIHGGAWVKAGKENVRDIQDTLLNHGIAVASINHRYANTSDVHYSQMLDDVDQALNYCSQHALAWNTRKDGFVMVGASSGGHLALLSAYTTSKNIKAVVEFSGPTNVNDTTLLNYASKVGLIDAIQRMTGKNYIKGAPLDIAYAQSSPITQVKNIPVLMIHGTSDVVVPFSQSEMLDRKLTSLGFEHKLLAIPNAGHDLNMNDLKTRSLVLTSAVDWVLKYGH
ncbi:acetyl esterase/lipase [Algoriphagus sp. 4150]|uniref:prolyl oligopeptidase family serine peptidase n=1 Tax=Algoriphagus sp. 4150 TaxID=2817756 RepID=UPI00285A9468|nr:prolyl oligopeptidase family serine peptidase [Algoriphagus sp. 4150]MDR7128329.1 acetyl esterase/lipase [Algoriphagus sp. 4150]